LYRDAAGEFFTKTHKDTDNLSRWWTG
jgi:hypothetical protein